MPQLDFLSHPFASQYFWLFLSFAVLYLTSAKFILPKISNIRSERKNIIESSMSEASEMKDTALNSSTNFDATLKDARSKAEVLINEALERIHKQENAALYKASIELEAEYNDLVKKLSDYKESAQAEFDNIVGDLAQFILEQKYGIKNTKS